MLNTGPSCALTVFIRNTSLQIQTSPVEVPENAISSVQPYTAHIIVSVLPIAPMQPFLPISPPPGLKEKQVIESLLVIVFPQNYVTLPRATDLSHLGNHILYKASLTK